MEWFFSGLDQEMVIGELVLSHARTTKCDKKGTSHMNVKNNMNVAKEAPFTNYQRMKDELQRKTIHTKMLGNFEHKSWFATLYLKGVEDWWKIIVELYIYDSANDSCDPPLEATASSGLRCRGRTILSCIIKDYMKKLKSTQLC